jgi:signal transduction histidine kinase
MIEEEDSDPLTADQRRFLEVIHRNAERLLRLAGDLLTVARADAGRMQLRRQAMDLGRVVADCAESCRPQAGERGIELELDAPRVAMAGDQQRLAEVVDNLVSNALKFTPPGGRVSLRARTDGDRAILEVADTGMGIPAAELPSLFKRFYRTERALTDAIPGTGLGLSISKMIVEAHGGTIAVVSREGAGTRFRVELPAGPADAEGVATSVEDRRGSAA